MDKEQTNYIMAVAKLMAMSPAERQRRRAEFEANPAARVDYSTVEPPVRKGVDCSRYEPVCKSGCCLSEVVLTVEEAMVFRAKGSEGADRKLLAKKDGGRCYYFDNGCAQYGRSPKLCQEFSCGGDRNTGFRMYLVQQLGFYERIRYIRIIGEFLKGNF